MFKRNQIVTVGIAGIHSQYQGKIIREDKMPGWWIVREIPADAERASFLRSMPRAINGACVHESQLA